MMELASIHVGQFISHLVCVSNREDTEMQPLIELVPVLLSQDLHPVATNSHTTSKIAQKQAI